MLNLYKYLLLFIMNLSLFAKIVSCSDFAEPGYYIFDVTKYNNIISDHNVKIHIIMAAKKANFYYPDDETRTIYNFDAILEYPNVEIPYRYCVESKSDGLLQIFLTNDLKKDSHSTKIYLTDSIITPDNALRGDYVIDNIEDLDGTIIHTPLRRSTFRTSGEKRSRRGVHYIDYKDDLDGTSIHTPLGRTTHDSDNEHSSKEDYDIDTIEDLDGTIIHTPLRRSTHDIDNEHSRRGVHYIHNIEN